MVTFLDFSPLIFITVYGADIILQNLIDVGMEVQEIE